MKNNRQEEHRKGVLAWAMSTALNEKSVNRLVAYKAPEIEVIEVEVEKGFATSGGSYPGFPGENPF